MGEVDAVDMTGCSMLCAKALSAPIHVFLPQVGVQPERQVLVVRPAFPPGRPEAARCSAGHGGSRRRACRRTSSQERHIPKHVDLDQG